MTGVALILAAALVAADVRDEWRFDFGPVDLQPPAGYERVSPQTMFDAALGWGWEQKPRVRAFGPRGKQASPLLDGIEMTSKATGEPPAFAVQLPNGRYVVSFLSRVHRSQAHNVQQWAVELPPYRPPAYVWSEIVVDVTDGLLRLSAGRAAPRHWSMNLLVVRPSANDLEEPGPRQLLVTRAPRGYDDLPHERQVVRHWPTAAETPEGVTVDNGRLRVIIRRAGCGFLDEVWLDGERIVSAPEGWRGAFADVVRLSPDAGGVVGVPGVRGRVVPSMLAIESVALVHNIWPVAVRVKGHFLHADAASEYQLDLHIPQDKPYVIAQLRTGLESSSDNEMLSSLGLSLPVQIDEKHPAFVRTRLPVPCEGDTDAPTDEWRLRTGPLCPWWRLGGVFQQSPEYAWNWKASRHDCRPIVTSSGRLSEGWIELCDWRWGVRVGIPSADLHARAPKELLADARDRSVSVLFWSPRARPLDLRTPATLDAAGKSVYTAYLWFFRTGSQPDATLRRLVDADLSDGVLK